MKSTPLDICKKYYPKIYRLYMQDSDECKMMAYNLYYHNWASTIHEKTAKLCKEIGFRVREDNDFMEGLYRITY